MDPMGNEYRTALIRLAERVVGDPDPSDPAAFLRRFRAAYQHLAATVDASSARALALITPEGWASYPGQGPLPDPEKRREQAQALLDASEEGLKDLG